MPSTGSIYVFGILLILTGIRMARSKGHAVDPERNPVLRAFRRVVPMTTDYDGQGFIVRHNGRLLATPLLAVLVIVETSDIMFAIDSIPAIFAITTDPFIVFSSNVFAILGLRSLYFLLAGLLPRFAYLKIGLAALLVFAGVKIMSQRPLEDAGPGHPGGDRRHPRDLDRRLVVEDPRRQAACIRIIPDHRAAADARLTCRATTARLASASTFRSGRGRWRLRGLGSLGPWDMTLRGAPQDRPAIEVLEDRHDVLAARAGGITQGRWGERLARRQGQRPSDERAVRGHGVGEVGFQDDDAAAPLEFSQAGRWALRRPRRGGQRRRRRDGEGSLETVHRRQERRIGCWRRRCDDSR